MPNISQDSLSKINAHAEKTPYTVGFHQWNYFNNKVWSTQPTSTADSKGRKTTEKRNISPQTLNNGRDFKNLGFCLNKSDHFTSL